MNKCGIVRHAREIGVESSPISSSFPHGIRIKMYLYVFRMRLGKGVYILFLNEPETSIPFLIYYQWIEISLCYETFLFHVRLWVLCGSFLWVGQNHCHLESGRCDNPHETLMKWDLSAFLHGERRRTGFTGLPRILMSTSCQGYRKSRELTDRGLFYSIIDSKLHRELPDDVAVFEYCKEHQHSHWFTRLDLDRTFLWFAWSSLLG